ncbi:YqhA family protein [uncultured Methanobrevibacter sp.]|uniref:YqhA family protein n=1 Tax=uncultured Methanobrevibacter sp. TaxID=253161 RepID=UPI00261A43CA|nr:YqhA family protein [uncultured Methanobrevibacter sp.]
MPEEKKPIFEVVDKRNVKHKPGKDDKKNEKYAYIEQKFHYLRHLVERGIEFFLFGSRWILSIMYLILIIVLILILGKFVFEVYDFVLIMQTLNTNQWIVRILELLDLTLVANLVLIVTISGYENFVSKIDAAERSDDRLPWMGRLDFSGLKIKIIGSVVAISLIELLQDFLNATTHVDPNFEFWRIVLHLTFVITGLVFAGMEVLTEKRHEMKTEEEFQEKINKF